MGLRHVLYIYIYIIRYSTSTVEIPGGADSKARGGEGGFSKFGAYTYIPPHAANERAVIGHVIIYFMYVYIYRSAYTYIKIYRYSIASSRVIVRRGEESFIYIYNII